MTKINGTNKGIYLIPNILTTAGLFAGFYAIVAAQQNKFGFAAVAIFIAMLADGLDGRIARLMNTSTDFGVQYDSLADVISFAVAPGLVVYNWSLFQLGKVGWLAAFLFIACGTLRLARFNSQVAVQDKKYFQGLPIPAAAAVIASLVWLGSQYQFRIGVIVYAVFALTAVLALLMISNYRYYSFKELDIKGRVPFVMTWVIILLLVAVALHPPTILFIISSVYAFSGPVMTIWLRYQKRRHKRLR